MLLSSAFVAQPSGTVRRLRVRRLGVGRPSQLTAGSKGHRHDCRGHQLNDPHIYRNNYHHDLAARWFSVAVVVLLLVLACECLWFVNSLPVHASGSLWLLLLSGCCGCLGLSVDACFG